MVRQDDLSRDLKLQGIKLIYEAISFYGKVLACLCKGFERECKNIILRNNTMSDESPIIFTDSCCTKVADLIAEENNPDLKLRVFVNGGGCSGFQYGFTFDEIKNDDDFEIEKNGLVFLVDPMSYQYLVGAEIDYTESLQGSQFVIRNPNAETTCGCGSSFSV